MFWITRRYYHILKVLLTLKCSGYDIKHYGGAFLQFFDYLIFSFFVIWNLLVTIWLKTIWGNYQTHLSKLDFQSIEILHETFTGILLANKVLTENQQWSTPFNLMKVQIPYKLHGR